MSRGPPKMRNEAPAQTDISRPTTGFRSPELFQMHHKKSAVCETYAAISYAELGSRREERRDRVRGPPKMRLLLKRTYLGPRRDSEAQISFKCITRKTRFARRTQRFRTRNSGASARRDATGSRADSGTLESVDLGLTVLLCHQFLKGGLLLSRSAEPP